MAHSGKDGGLRESPKRFRAGPRAKRTPPKAKAAARPREGNDIAKIFMNGRSQAVRLPKQFRLQGKSVRVRREGDAIVLEPIKRDWDEVFAEIDRLVKGKFPERAEQPPMPDDHDLDSFD